MSHLLLSLMLVFLAPLALASPVAETEKPSVFSKFLKPEPDLYRRLMRASIVPLCLTLMSQDSAEKTGHSLAIERLNIKQTLEFPSSDSSRRVLYFQNGEVRDRAQIKLQQSYCQLATVSGNLKGRVAIRPQNIPFENARSVPYFEIGGVQFLLNCYGNENRLWPGDGRFAMTALNGALVDVKFTPLPGKKPVPVVTSPLLMASKGAEVRPGVKVTVSDHGLSCIGCEEANVKSQFRRFPSDRLLGETFVGPITLHTVVGDWVIFSEDHGRGCHSGWLYAGDTRTLLAHRLEQDPSGCQQFQNITAHVDGDRLIVLVEGLAGQGSHLLTVPPEMGPAKEIFTYSSVQQYNRAYDKMLEKASKLKSRQQKRMMLQKWYEAHYTSLQQISLLAHGNEELRKQLWASKFLFETLSLTSQNERQKCPGKQDIDNDLAAMEPAYERFVQILEMLNCS